MRRALFAGLLSASVLAMNASGATLPPHRPLRILVVSDTVNPHALSSADLTEGLDPGPGDIGNTLRRAGTGINLDAAPDAVTEVPTNSIEQATQRLLLPACDPASYDVLVYFSHRIPEPDALKPETPVTRQNNFTTAVSAFLTAGGGMVSFHHGSYTSSGKTGILDVVGASAGGPVPWNTMDGQNVIGVAPGHFVTTHGIEYSGTASYQDDPRGVPAGTYPFFNNTPDERYPFFNFNGTAGTTRTLFASDYNDNGTTHILGFTHRRSQWGGVVVGYQPAEYQPHALDDLEGNNFQVLANAILYAADSRLRNDVLLTVGRGAIADEILLQWSGGEADYSVFRSVDALDLTDRCSRLGSTAAHTWTDTSPPGGLVFYQVGGP